MVVVGGYLKDDARVCIKVSLSKWIGDNAMCVNLGVREGNNEAVR